MDAAAPKKRILILGGGFAGAYTALQLEKRLAGATDVEIALVTRENFVLFTPMLHEGAGSQHRRWPARTASPAVHIQDDRPPGNHRPTHRRGGDLRRAVLRVRRLVPLARDLPGQAARPPEEVRVALDWTLDVVFSKDIVQVPTLRAPTVSDDEKSSTANDSMSSSA
jgi:hypothetical protein